MSHFSKNLLPSICYSLLLLLVMSCGSGKDLSDKQTGTKNAFIYGAEARQKSTYEDIKGNIPRFKAMICGAFVHYTLNDDNTAYTAWLVNGGKDSVMLYRLPVGNANKDGHWVYHLQYLTSLPDEPIYAAFSKLESINRDSIKETFYSVPDDFSLNIEKIMAKPEAAFKDFDFKKLKPDPAGEIIVYERKNIYQYAGYTSLRPTESQLEERKGGFDGEYYEVSPELYVFNRVYYTKEKRKIAHTEDEHMRKIARIHPKYIQ